MGTFELYQVVFRAAGRVSDTDVRSCSYHPCLFYLRSDWVLRIYFISMVSFYLTTSKVLLIRIKGHDSSQWIRVMFY